MNATPNTVLRAVWRHLLVPLAALTSYFMSLSLFYSQFLLEVRTVNVVFVNRAWKYSLILTAVSYLIFFVAFKLTKRARLSFESSVEKVRAIDLILVLLPLTPVIQYILNNQEMLSPLGALYVLAVFVAFSMLYAVVLPTLLGVIGSTKTLMVLGVAFSFMVTNMASLSHSYAWFSAGSLKVQLVLFGAIFAAGWLLYSNQISRKFMYVLVAIFFITGIAFQFAPGGRNGTSPARIDVENELVELVGSKKPLSTPNIYLLVYDAYVINDTMLAYSIDNSAQEEYLEALGFKLYPHTYSIAANSIGTMSSVLNASTELYGTPRRGVSGGGIVQSLLKSFGYETYGIFPYDYFFLGTGGSSYDFSFPEAEIPSASAHRLLVRSIFMGEFRADVEFGSPSREQFVEHKVNTFDNLPDTPSFMYMHDGYPGHSQNSGACRSNETEIYRGRLITANHQMKQDVETIIQNDPDAIVIVAGDHGPYLTKNCIGTGSQYDIAEISRLDIQDRYGTFLAIKWPTEDFAEYDNITVLQDIFPSIFAYLFEDEGFLEAKVEPDTLDSSTVSGAQVKNGIIHGGTNDGDLLFVSGGE